MIQPAIDAVYLSIPPIRLFVKRKGGDGPFKPNANIAFDRVGMTAAAGFGSSSVV
jgi:hypothetical protein